MLNLQSRESEAEHLDRALDEALVETFPASDPPAVLIDDVGDRVRAGLVPATSTGDTPMDRIKPLFTATATATGGRNGHTEASDGSVRADLSVPKAMGGPGKANTTTPEHLFAAGYAACFGGALDYVAKQQKKDASHATATADVSIGPREGGGFGLAVRLHVE